MNDDDVFSGPYGSYEEAQAFEESLEARRAAKAKQVRREKVVVCFSCDQEPVLMYSSHHDLTATYVFGCGCVPPSPDLPPGLEGWKVTLTVHQALRVGGKPHEITELIRQMCAPTTS